jgi:hypothetical protein
MVRPPAVQQKKQSKASHDEMKKNSSCFRDKPNHPNLDE